MPARRSPRVAEVLPEAAPAEPGAEPAADPKVQLPPLVQLLEPGVHPAVVVDVSPSHPSSRPHNRLERKN